MNLEQSAVLIDRSLVTLCAELPESLGLYNTAKDEFTIGAIRSVPMLEHLMPESRKHLIIRDWMRTYEPHEDQPLTSDVSFDSLRETMKVERKKRVKEAKERDGELLSDDDEPLANMKSQKSKRSKGKGKAPSAKQTEKKTTSKPRQRIEISESEAEDSDVSTSSTPSSSGLDDDESSDEDSDDSDRKRSKSRSRAKTKITTKNTRTTKGKGKEKRKPKSAATPKPKRSTSGRSNLPPIEVVLSSDEDDDEPDALFDAEDPDVYEVESILDKRRGNFGEPDKYLIKWVGYEETTWEPAENVSKDLIEEFEGQPVRENEYVVEEILDRKTVRDKQTNLKTFKYFVKWVGYVDKTWEPAENLPHNLRRKFDAKYEARKRRRMN